VDVAGLKRLDFSEADWTPCEQVPHDKTVLLARQEAGEESLYAAVERCSMGCPCGQGSTHFDVGAHLRGNRAAVLPTLKGEAMLNNRRSTRYLTHLIISGAFT